jgi:hypothetical protein
VVAALVDDDWHEEIWFTYRRSIAKMTGLLNDQVGRALGALKRLGFVEFRRGLFTEDGEVAGCGYRVTRDGYAWWWEHEAPAGSAEGVAPTQLREAQQ